jgi:hypothetical protein
MVSLLTTRSQRLTLDRQRDHDIVEHRRVERREIFIEYLAAYSELREKALAMREQPKLQSIPLAEQFLTEVARFSRAYQALRIFSSPATGQAAHDCSSHLWDLADAVLTNDTPAHQLDPSRHGLGGEHRASAAKDGRCAPADDGLVTQDQARSPWRHRIERAAASRSFAL